MKTISVTIYPRPPRPTLPLKVRPAKAAHQERPAPELGLGDWVERWAKPLARWIDRMSRRLPPRWWTRLAGCSACSRRRRWLNLALPNVRSWRAWLAAARLVWPAWKAVFRPAAGPMQTARREGARRAPKTAVSLNLPEKS